MDLDLHDVIRLVNTGMVLVATLALLWLIHEVRLSRKANRTSLGAVRRAVYQSASTMWGGRHPPIPERTINGEDRAA